MKTEMIVTLFFAVLIGGGIGLGIWFINTDMGILPEGFTFCRDKGFEGVELYGTYSEKFGKVSCISCYKDDCIFEEFKVKKRFGIIMEDKS